jgi:hypothetical protein
MRRLASRGVCPIGFRRGSPRVYLLNQPGQHSSDLIETCIQGRMLLVGEQSKVTSQEEEIFQLTRRSGRDMEKLTELRSTGSGASFRDIGRHRRRRSPHLTRDSVAFVFGKGRGCCIDAQNERMAILPDLELFIVLHSASLTYLFLCIYLQLITNNCQQLRGAKC